MRQPQLRPPKKNRTPKFLRRLLLGLSLMAATGSGSIAGYLVYEATLTPPPVQSAPDLRLLARDPGGVYDRTPMTPNAVPNSGAVAYAVAGRGPAASASTSAGEHALPPGHRQHRSQRAGRP